MNHVLPVIRTQLLDGIRQLTKVQIGFILDTLQQDMSLITLYLLTQILSGISARLRFNVLKYLIQAFFEQSPTEHPLELIVANLSRSRILSLLS